MDISQIIDYAKSTILAHGGVSGGRSRWTDARRGELARLVEKYQ